MTAAQSAAYNTMVNSHYEDADGNFVPNMRKVPTGDLMLPHRKTNGLGVQADDTRICVVMVGLPARGKSLIATKGTNPIPPRLECTS